MSNKSTDFLAAIYQLADDHGLDQNAVLDVIKKAILTAYKKLMKEEFETDDDMSHFDVDIDTDSGEFIILADKKVVSMVTDPKTQLLESQAKLIDSRLREGDHIQIDVTPEDFGRIAAQAAKQRISQGLRDAVRDTMIAKYQDKVGKIVSGVIQRRDPNNVLIEIERAEAIMPASEQIPGEMYRSAERKRFLLVRLANTATDKRMVLSRASGDFLKALFEMEIPEISTGNVEIVNISREAGSRAKVAVKSSHDKVDAIGACVGPRGTRIETIMNEVYPEKVDIILWDNDIRTYIINSLSPAKILDIRVNVSETYAKVLVAEDVLSLAIGKDGQNARLAAKLTGYKIDITADKADFDKEKEVEKAEEPQESDTEEKPKTKKASKSKTEKPAKEDKKSKTKFEDLDFTARQKKILEENKVDSLKQLKDIASGKLEIAQFSKRDVEKIKGLLG